MMKRWGQVSPSSEPQQGVVGRGKHTEEGGTELAADEADEGLPVLPIEGLRDAAQLDALHEGVKTLSAAVAGQHTIVEQVVVVGGSTRVVVTAAAIVVIIIVAAKAGSVCSPPVEILVSIDWRRRNCYCWWQWMRRRWWWC
jgi:hypothetical protein